MPTLVKASPARDALYKAADIYVIYIRESASFVSRRIAAVVHKYRRGDFVYIAAGNRGGKWGWTPIIAWMFNEPHAGPIPKHPLWGNRKYWKYQPYRPYMDAGAAKAEREALDLYAEACQKIWNAEFDFK